MKIQELSFYLQELENLSSRNTATELISELLKKLSSNEVAHVLYFIQGKLAPKYVNLEFSMAKKSLIKALETRYDKQLVSSLMREYGDIGYVIQKLKEENIILQSSLFEEQKLDVEQGDLEISEIFEKLEEIAKLSGKGSQEAKQSAFIDLIAQVDALSAKYIGRIIVGELRLGISDKTILDAFSWYVAGDKSLRSEFDRAFGARSDIGEIGKILLTSKNVQESLNEITVTPGVPVASKLVEREKDPEGVWNRMPNCFVQPKLDGLRGQLHYDKNTGTSEIYSRNMESLTNNFPELLSSLEVLNVDSIILDSEIIGFDEEANTYLTYQETMQRRRKYDVDEYAKNIPVRAMCFDVLYLNGKDLTTEPIEMRVKILHELLGTSVMSLHMLETMQMNSLEQLDEYFQTKVGDGLEGIITKATESTYEPGSRNFKWIKLKANTKSELVDTIDVVVLGYYIGQGQRAKHGIGALLTGVYNPNTDSYYSIGKVGSGMTDEMLQKIKEDLSNIEILDKPENVFVENSLTPDTWVTPKIIIEIIADEITRSPNHTAAKGVSSSVKKDIPERGLSVRFPRIKVWDRDKDYPNTVDEVVRMYELRKG